MASHETAREKPDGNKNPKADLPVVFLVRRDSECTECGAPIPEGNLLSIEAGKPLCMQCAGYGDLEMLFAGDTALTRRATKQSSRTVVVVQWSRTRKRYERQGILVESAAIDRAESENASDAEGRAATRAAAADARKREDRRFVRQLVEQLKVYFPGCPPNRAITIAEHTAVRGSGRVGRSAAARRLEEGALRAAVAAAIRHNYTNYEDLMAAGMSREDARESVADAVREILESWQMRGRHT